MATMGAAGMERAGAAGARSVRGAWHPKIPGKNEAKNKYQQNVIIIREFGCLYGFRTGKIAQETTEEIFETYSLR